MKKRMKRIIAIAMTAATLAGNAFTTYADYINGGRWTAKENLEWTTNNGEKIVVGRGTVFSEIHSEIKDPEHFLKEYYCYPSESEVSYNSQGQLKKPYTNKMDASLPLLQEFLHSFDWINSDELTRAIMVWKRIAHQETSNNNMYGGVHESERWQILRTGLGRCQEFSDDFAKLCNLVGLESITYIPSYNHQACLLNIGGQWLAVDPTNATSFYDNTNYPVDYETEYNRLFNEQKETEWYQEQMQQVEWQRMAEAAEITWIEYYQRIYPGMSEAEIQQKFMGWDGYVDGLGN